MTKVRFLLSLHEKLADLPQDEAEERLSFYSEMIEDRIEEGLSEEEAVLSVGTVEEIASQIIADVPFAAAGKEKTTPKKRHKTWEILLLILGAPVWLSVLIAMLAAFFSLYISLWAVILAFWAVFLSLSVVAPCGAVGGVLLAVFGNTLAGTAAIGAGLTCAGLAVLLFFGCMAATKGAALLAQKMITTIKKSVVGGMRNE